MVTTVVEPPEARPGVLNVEPWPTERPLFVLSLLASAGLWLIAIVSIAGILYAAVIGFVVFLMHVAFVAHVRGNGIRVSESQLPDIHAAVSRLSARFGLKPPETYVIQGGGMLNALATRFIARDMVVLFSDLLDACEEREAARDMIIAHELGHLHRGHLRWRLLIAPAMLIPFLGSALSRAREYTCDRYGAAGAGERAGAVHGLTVLAAGGRIARRVDMHAFAGQQHDLNTGWMTLSEWLSSHPPLAKRVARIDPTLAPVGLTPSGPARAAAIVTAMFASVVIASFLAVLLPAFREASVESGEESSYTAPPPAVAAARAKEDLEKLAQFLANELAAGRDLPWNTEELYQRWAKAHAGQPEPLDPYDGERYLYESKGSQFRLWSIGPDFDSSKDDPIYDSRRGWLTR